MLHQKYPFSLPPLLYGFDALEPYIDAETVYYHHDKHFKAYVDNLNEALAPHPALYNQTLRGLLLNGQMQPESARRAIHNNAGGVYNHDLYFKGLAPKNENVHEPKGELLALINRTFGSFLMLKERFNQSALSVFGSGYTILALTPQSRLNIVNVKNQDTLLGRNYATLIIADVWEHAYYLKYKNRRKEYVDNIWNLLVIPEIYRV